MEEAIVDPVICTEQDLLHRLSELTKKHNCSIVLILINFLTPNGRPVLITETPPPIRKTMSMDAMKTMMTTIF
jgi:hypothetical protein